MKEREDYIAGLRAIADFLESHESVPLPLTSRFDTFVYTKEEFAAAARAVGGKLEKQDYGSILALRRQFGPLQFDLNCDRELVCTRVVKGKRMVPAIPAVPEHEEDVVTWECGSVLAEAKVQVAE